MDEKHITALVEQAIAYEAALGWQKIILAILDWPFLLFVLLAGGAFKGQPFL